jgi:hypothetical protein
MGIYPNPESIEEDINTVKALLSDYEANGLNAILETSPSDVPLGPNPVIRTAEKPIFLTFNDDAESRFKHALGTDVVLVPEGAEDGEVAKSKFPGIFTEGENVPILLIDAKADLAFKPPHWCCRAMKFLEVTRENYDGLVVTVVVHESFDAMKKEHFLLPALAHIIENSIVTIFCTEAEVPQCKTFFAGAKFDEEDVVMLLAMQGIPFPRMHQFTFGTAMGEEIEDSSLLGAAVTVGTSNEGSGLDAMKFYANREGAGKNGSKFVLQDSDFKPMVERLIVGRTDGIR